MRNLLKVCNKRVLDNREVAGQALIFLNQLGKKLLVKQHQHMKKKRPSNVSTENNKIESNSSNFSASSQEETRNTSKLDVMMSPIKTRKQILKPNLNCEQESTLNLWKRYKDWDKLSISSNSEEGKRNSSQTPVMRHIFFPNASPKNENDDAKSCRKVSEKKSKKKKRVRVRKVKKSKASKVCKNEKKNFEESMFKNMIVLSHKDNSQPKSPRKRTKKKARYASKKLAGKLPVSNIIQGLDDILNEMEDGAPEARKGRQMAKSKKSSPRKMSCEIVGEQEIPSPKKSPRKSPRKMRPKRRK